MGARLVVISLPILSSYTIRLSNPPPPPSSLLLLCCHNFNQHSSSAARAIIIIIIFISSIIIDDIIITIINTVPSSISTASSSSSTPSSYLSTMATNNSPRLKYAPELYPPVSELMIALQDEGKETFNKKNVMTMKYGKLHKYSKDLHNLLASRKTVGLDTNITRGARRILNIIISLRRTVDVSTLPEALIKYRLKPENVSMFIINRDPTHAGYPLIIHQINEYLKTNISAANTIRTPNDALRVCGILLHWITKGFSF